MRVFCPNCANELILEDKYAEQEVQCPLCNDYFRAPALPSYPQASATPFTAGGIAAAPAAGVTAASTAPAAPSAPTEPLPTAKPEPVPAPQRSTEYTGKVSIWFSPRVLQWVPAGALFLIIVLSAFTWVWFGYYDVTVASQNGWQVAFGLLSENPAYSEESPFSQAENRPGVGILTLFYLFLVVPTLGLAAVVAVMDLVPMQLPAPLEKILPWKWAIVAGILFFNFLFLGLQLGAVGFPMENVVHSKADKDYRAAIEAAAKDRDRKVYHEFQRARTIAGLHRTSFVTAVFWLHIIALVTAAYMFLMDFRKTAPIPRVDIMW